jgi:hypothetical protein
MSLRVRLIIFAAAALSIGLFFLTEIPLGIPGEWTWNRIRYTDGFWLTLPAVLLALAAYAVFALIAWAGERRITESSRAEWSGWLLALMATGFAWLHVVQNTPPAGLDAAKSPFVLYYPSSSGYFFKANYEVGSSAEFLRDYEEAVRNGDTLHEGTHPPGLFVLFRGLIAFAEAAPDVAALPQIVLPQSGEDGFEFIRSMSPRPLTEQAQAVLWLAAMLTQLAAVLVIVPLFLLIRLTLDRVTAWRAVCFWPLVPAVAVFIPKSDVLFAFGSSLLVCLWLYSVRATSSAPSISQRATAFFLGAAAGAVGWLGLFCSLAFLPAGAIAVVAAVLLFRKSHTEAEAADFSLKAQFLWSARQHFVPLTGGVVSFVMLTGLVWAVWDLNLFRVWQINYVNHTRFYEVSPRSYFGWLLVNPLELTLALGAPLTVLVACGVRREGARAKAGVGIRALLETRLAVPAAVGLIWGLLWLTGKNSGEAARLWIPLMPLALWAGAAVWDHQENSSDKVESEDDATREWLITLGVQALVCLVTVLLVTGFLKEQGGVG